MLKSVEDLQQLSRSQIEATTQSAAALSRGIQQIAIEASDFTKKSVEEGSATLTKLIGVTSLDGAIQLQSELARSTYDSFVAGSARFGELMAALTQDTYKPFEAAFEQAQGIAR